MNVAVLMPANVDGCPWRRRAFEWMLGHYQRNHPGWPVHVGGCGQPWSKGRAVDAAYRQTDAGMLVLADADSFVAPDVLCAAVAAAVVDGWAMPHATVYRLSRDATEAVYAGLEPRLDRLDRGAYRGVKGGGIVAIARTAYEAVGGIDFRFEGWGGEDLALGFSLNAIVGGGARLGGDLVHLWHPHPAPDLRGPPQSEALVARYRVARTSPEATRILIAERIADGCVRGC